MLLYEFCEKSSTVDGPLRELSRSDPEIPGAGHVQSKDWSMQTADVIGRTNRK